MFAQRLNMLTGEAEWVHVEAQGDGSPEDDSSDFVALSSYLDMLSDTFRNTAYRLALEAAVKPGDHVLDIGTGTGLLAMMAARLAQPSGAAEAEGPCVTACEVFPPMAALAKRVVRANGMERCVSIVAKRSNDLQIGTMPSDTRRPQDLEAAPDIPGKVDVIVTEIFDSELLGEGLLPTLRHAVPQLLKPGGTIVPHRARCFFQVVESEWLASCSSWSLRSGEQAAPGCKTTSAHVVPLQPMKELHVAPLHACGDLRPITSPCEMLTLSLASPPPGDRTEQRQIAAVSSGVAHAVIFWWQLEMDEAGTVLVSTAPPWITLTDQGSDGGARTWGIQHWREHWKTCWCPVGSQPFKVTQGRGIRVVAKQTELNVIAAASLADGVPNDVMIPSAAGLVSDLELSVSSPSRVHCLRDSTIWDRYKQIIQSHLEMLKASDERGTSCVMLGDSSPLVCIAAQADAISRVFVLLDHPEAGRRLITEALDGLGCDQDSKVVVSSLRAFTLRAKHDAFGQHKAAEEGCGLVVAEPFYRTCEGLLPWSILRYWHEVDTLRASGRLSAMAALVPCQARLVGVGICVPELWRTRQALSVVEGLDLRLANPLLGVVGPLIGSPSGVPPLLPCSSWQLGEGYQELTERVSLLEFDFRTRVQPLQGNCYLPFIAFGTCHGLLLYMEYDLDGTGNSVASCAPDPGCAPRPYGQALQILTGAVEISSTPECVEGLDVQVEWDAQDGTLQVMCVGPAVAGSQ